MLIETGADSATGEAITIGHNFEAVLGDLEARMRQAAGDLDFEEAARLRDEIKRLRQTELAVVDDPTAKHLRVQQGGRIFTHLPLAGKVGAQRREGESKVHKPDLDEMGIALWHEVKPARGGKRKGGPLTTAIDSSGPRKPDLDEMGPGVESVPGKSAGPRSTLGRPGMRGGWKGKKR